MKKNDENYSDNSNDEEELKDSFDEDLDNYKNINLNKNKYNKLDYNDFFDTVEFIDNKIPIYISNSDGPIFLCLHGCGLSATSFSILAKEIKSFASLISFDFLGHFQNKNTENSNELSIENLINETKKVLDYIINKYPYKTIVLLGHSMGGSVAVKFIKYLNEINYQNLDRIVGLIVIDVVEGTAINALPFMEKLVKSRPKFFDSVEYCIEYIYNSKIVRNLNSAKVSTESQLKKLENGKYTWKVDLLESEKYWMQWFKGLTNEFLNIKISKVLILAEADRMDTDLTIAQMQGKFKLVVFKSKVGHLIHEDDPKHMANTLYEFLLKFNLPLNTEELQKQKELGFGKFKNKFLLSK